MSHWSDILRHAVDFGTDPDPKHIHPGSWDGEPDCPACYVHTIRDALAGYEDEPDPTIREVGNPCDHDDAVVGRVEAGSLEGGPYCSVITCAACVVAAQGYVQAVTNRPASPVVIPFTVSRPGGVTE